MEQYTVIDLATGEIKRCGATEFAQAQPLAQGEGLYVGEQLTSRTHYFVDGLPVAYTEEELQLRASRPNFTCRWDVQQKVWVDERSVDELRAQLHAAIELERDRRMTAVLIVYDGKNLDADPRSLDLLTKKVATTGLQVELGITPADEDLVWRDADNVTHQFADLAAYRTWLAGFALALDGRGTAAYKWSWAKKGELIALGDDAGALREFDPEN